MDGLNALIATAGNYQPPEDYAKIQSNLLAQRHVDLQNRLLENQLAMEPQKLEMQKSLMQLKELGLEIREQALKAGPTVEVPFDLGGKSYKIKGPSQVVAQIGQSVNADPRSALDKNLMSWMAQNGVSVEEVQPKVPIPGSKEDIDRITAQETARQKVKQQYPDAGEPSIHPLVTTEGVYKWDYKTGKYELAKDPITGKTLMAPAASADLTGAKAEAEAQGKLKVEREKNYPKSREMLVGLERQWDNVDKTIDKALNQIGPFTVGWGAYLGSLPASEAKNLKENLETIKANVGFDKLQEMRNNSVTGGALGQVSDLENRLLQSVQGSLDQFQSSDQLKDHLRNIKMMVQQLKAQKELALQLDYSEQIKKQAQPTQPKAEPTTPAKPKMSW